MARGLVAMGSINQQNSSPEILAIPIEMLRTLSREQRQGRQQLQQ